MLKKLITFVVVLASLNAFVSTVNANQVYSTDEWERFEEVAETEGFDNLRIDEETGVLMLDNQLKTIISDKVAIETFSTEVYYFMENELPEIKNGIMFLGFVDDYMDYNVAATVMYFEEDNANQDWKNKPINHAEMYKQSSKFDCMSFLSKHIDYESRFVSEDDPIDMLMFYTFGSEKED